MLNRAYSCLDFKSVDDDQRIIEGTASTIETDRMGDVIEPKGAEYKLPLPLLWQHRSDQPIGQVISATVTKDGIKIRAQIAKDLGIARIDEAWTLLNAGLVRGLSIGFTPIESARIDGTWGMHILKWEWLELSAVTIPANASASIESIKSLDAPHLAATGQSASASSHPAGASASTRVVKAIPKDRSIMKKTYTEQIKDFENTRAAKAAERDAIMEKAAEGGLTLDAAQTEAYDTLTVELKSIDAHLVRLRELEKENAAAAVEVNGKTAEQASASRELRSVITVKDRLPPDLQFARMVLCKAASFLECSKGNFVSPLQIAKHRYPDSQQIHQYLEIKTAVAGGTTTDSNYAAALLATATTLESAFLEYLRPLTIIGKFGTNGIPSLRRVPFNVKIQSQTSGATSSWVGEGKAKPVTKFNTTSTTLLFNKIAAICVITEELARFSSPGAEGVVRDELTRSVIERMDYDFIDPDKAAVSAVSPASITNGLTPLTSAGVSAANVLTDLLNLIGPFATGNYNVGDLVLIMPNGLALALSLMQNSLGQTSFPGIGLNGGSLNGIPVITSQYAGFGSSYGNVVIAVSASNIALADDGKVSVDASREASIEMSDAPSGDATAGTGASMVSMFQTNSIALRAEREITWKKLRTTAVRFMDDVNWGSIGSPF